MTGVSSQNTVHRVLRSAGSPPSIDRLVSFVREALPLSCAGLGFKVATDVDIRLPSRSRLQMNTDSFEVYYTRDDQSKVRVAWLCETGEVASFTVPANGGIKRAAMQQIWEGVQKAPNIAQLVEAMNQINREFCVPGDVFSAQTQDKVRKVFIQLNPLKNSDIFWLDEEVVSRMVSILVNRWQGNLNDPVTLEKMQNPCLLVFSRTDQGEIQHFSLYDRSTVREIKRQIDQSQSGVYLDPMTRYRLNREFFIRPGCVISINELNARDLSRLKGFNQCKKTVEFYVKLMNMHLTYHKVSSDKIRSILNKLIDLLPKEHARQFRRDLWRSAGA